MSPHPPFLIMELAEPYNPHSCDGCGTLIDIDEKPEGICDDCWSRKSQYEMEY